MAPPIVTATKDVFYWHLNKYCSGSFIVPRRQWAPPTCSSHSFVYLLLCSLWWCAPIFSDCEWHNVSLHIDLPVRKLTPWENKRNRGDVKLKYWKSRFVGQDLVVVVVEYDSRELYLQKMYKNPSQMIDILQFRLKTTQNDFVHQINFDVLLCVFGVKLRIREGISHCWTQTSHLLFIGVLMDTRRIVSMKHVQDLVE